MAVSAHRRLALLLPELEAGGAQRVMLLLAREFAARGHAVDLVLLRSTGALLAEVPAGVRLVDLGAREHGLGGVGFGLSSIHRLAAWLRRERPDALLSTITGANLVAVLATRVAAVPTRIVINHAAAADRFGSAARGFAARRIYRRADAVVAMTRQMAEQMANRLGVPPERIHSIPNPIDAVAVRAGADAPLAHPWFDDPTIRVVVSVGRLVPEKDYGTLLRAMAALPESLPIRLILVGDGPERGALEALAQTLRLAGRVHFAGFDLNPWRWMARADLFVLSSRSEGHPIALLEALSLGLPAVVTEYDASIRALARSFPIDPVPVAAPDVLAAAIRRVCEAEKRPPRPRAEVCDGAVDDYLAVLLDAPTSSSKSCR